MLSRWAELGRAAALRRRAVSCAQAPFVPTRATSGIPPLSPRPDFYVRDRYLSTLTALLLRPSGCFRGYVRMRRRSPPVQRPPESESESESESEFDAKESDLTAEEAGQIDDDGDESEEWEGFMIDFGAVGKDKDKDKDNQMDDDSYDGKSHPFRAAVGREVSAELTRRERFATASRRQQLMASLPWTPATAAVYQYLTSALSHRGAAALPYAEDARGTVHQHLAALSHAFPTLRPTDGIFTHNDGRGATLLRAEGTIPLATSSFACLPVSIWLLEAYPRLPPAVFLSFPPGTALKPRHPLVEPSGSVSVPYLRSWIFPYYNLVDLVRSLAQLFSQDPPFAISPTDAKAKETAKVVEAVQRHLGAAGKSHTAEMEALLDTQTQLERRKAEIARGLTRLEEEKQLLEEQLQMLIMNCDVTGSWVAKNHRRPTASLDGGFEPSDARSRRTMECVAADMAAEDVMYALDEALREGCVPLDAYLKSVRTISREQFFHRAFFSAKLAFSTST